VTDTPAERHAPRDGGLVAIAVFKLVKASLLIAVALGAFRLMHPGVADAAERWGATLSSGIGRKAVESMMERVGNLSTNRILLVGLAALAYASLFLVEGVGLLRQKRWAEWLSVIATGSLIPFEAYEIVQHASAARIAALVVNIAVVAYLAFRLVTTRKPTEPASPSRLAGHR